MLNIPGKELLLVGALAVAAACGSDSTRPLSESAVGNYTAISFTTSGASGQRDELVAGSAVTLNLAANGSTSGHLHIAPTNTDPAFDADLAGTWHQTGNVVTFTQTADTFIRDLQLTLERDPANGWVLVGDQNFSGTNVKITLKRTG
jgi:hypothetical protein